MGDAMQKLIDTQNDNYNKLSEKEGDVLLDTDGRPS